MSNDARIAFALLKRDMVMLRKKISGMVIDTASVVFTQTIIFGRILPILGMPKAWIAPVYMGVTASFIFFLAFGFGLRNIFDLEYGRTIDYRITLPISKRWLFAQHIAYFVIETLAITIPLLCIGIFFLRDSFADIQPNFLLFALVYLLTLVFEATLFLGMSFQYSFHWFSNNLWPRRLSIMFSFSPFNYPWAKVFTFAPSAAYLMLANPITYICEGFRSTLLGGGSYIAWYWCLLMLCLFQGLAIWLLSCGVQKRLDPV